MGRRKKGEPPQMRRHKASNRAYVTHDDGSQEYLGPWGSREAKLRYAEIVARWRKDHAAKHRPVKVPRCGLTVAEVVDAFITGNEARVSQSYLLSVGNATGPLLARYADLPASQFRQRELKDVRLHWTSPPRKRRTVNGYVSLIQSIWKWAASEDLVDPAGALAVAAVLPLKKGELGLPESEPVLPVSLRHFVKTLKGARRAPTFRDMLKIGYFLGCRPGELCEMQAEEIHQDGVAYVQGRRIKAPALPLKPGEKPTQLWVFQPTHSKVDKKVSHLVYVIGPQAMSILKNHLRKNPQGYLWNPNVVTEEHLLFRRGGKPISKRAARRRVKSRKNKPGEFYEENSFNGAIRRICNQQGIPLWHANQMRHAFVSRADQAFGIQAASNAVGHTQLNTTALYAEKTLERAAEVAARFG